MLAPYFTFTTPVSSSRVKEIVLPWTNRSKYSVNPVYFILFHTGLLVGSGERLCSEAGEHRKGRCSDIPVQHVPPLQPNVSGANEELPAETQARFSAYSMQTV
jgi:hypothetical protein